MRHSWLLLAAGGLWGCAEDSASAGAALTVEIQIEQGGINKTCPEVPGIDGLELRLLNPGTNTLRPGFPQPFDCQSGLAQVMAAPGDYVLEVAAIGSLDGTPGATLYSARSPVTLPRAETLRLSLKPEVAFLSLEWSYGDTNGDPCAEEVTEVVARIGTYEQRFACQPGPQSLSRSFGLRSYTIELSALSSEGVPLYVHRTERQLQRGDNQYTAVLSPRGHRLYLDWEFGLAGARIRACSDPQVMVDEVVLEVGDRDGGAPIVERVPCAASRPYALRASRFFAGRELVLRLSASGAAEFSAQTQFTMPDEDYQSEPLTLEARGDVTMGLVVVTASCGVASRFDLAVRTADRNNLVVAEASLNDPGESADFAGLPYGRYLVEAVQQSQGGPGCRAQGLRTVDAATVTWEPLQL
ncbi:MAG: hypothetical protein IPG45_13115 [Deltaproteobacteria bacterium]|nr:hypothetical protein [Deltaproteobacteria bacterium]